MGLLAFSLFFGPWMVVAAFALWGQRASDLILPILFMGGLLAACLAYLHAERSYRPEQAAPHQIEQP